MQTKTILLIAGGVGLLWYLTRKEKGLVLGTQPQVNVPREPQPGSVTPQEPAPSPIPPTVFENPTDLGATSNVAPDPVPILDDPDKAYIARYTLGRDYHKLIRRRLAKLARRIEEHAGGGRYRAFVDSAPVLERALA